MYLNHLQPHAALKSIVREYRVLDFDFGKAEAIPFKAYLPMPEHSLQFFAIDPERIHYPLNPQQSTNGFPVSIVGVQTQTMYRHVPRRFRCVHVVLQPGGLFCLTGVPMQQVADTYLDATLLLGTDVLRVNEQLAAATTSEAMLELVERYLLQLVRRRQVADHPVVRISEAMLHKGIDYGVDYFVKEACLSLRQFDRKFNEMVGVPPGQFLQLVRLMKSFYLRNHSPKESWLTIAASCGYHDYQHMARAYKTYAGCTPQQFYQLECRAPERFFGDVDC